MAEIRKWLGHAGDSSDSLAKDIYLPDFGSTSFLIMVARFVTLDP
jgi:hypothetical protein